MNVIDEFLVRNNEFEASYEFVSSAHRRMNRSNIFSQNYFDILW